MNNPYKGASAPPAPEGMALSDHQISPIKSPVTRVRRRYFFRSPIGSSPIVSNLSDAPPDSYQKRTKILSPPRVMTDDTPFMWSLLFNIMVVVVLTALVELLGLPLVEFAVREPIDAKSRMGRLISALLAAILFVSKVKGALALICALIAGFHTTDILQASLQEEFIPFFLIYFAVFYTIFEWVFRVTELGVELGHQGDTITSIG